MNQIELVDEPELAMAKSWKEAVAARDVDKIVTLLDEQVTLKVPFTSEVIEGRAAALKTFKRFDSLVEDFTYDNTLVCEETCALIFRGKVGEHLLDGLDVFHLNAAGSKIAHIEVLARPLAAIQALATRYFE